MYYYLPIIQCDPIQIKVNSILIIYFTHTSQALIYFILFKYSSGISENILEWKNIYNIKISHIL